ncbi:hypothetical protein DL770_002741 [Monosporascus sp. CRB-9-2]|nr:hypothetical protein DL770_002741 [Monosporascus sp. CRB-9-2]
MPATVLAGNNLMEYQSWGKHKDGCVFRQNAVTTVYSTGHASLATLPDGSRDYMVCYAQTPKPKSDVYRTTRIQRFT